MRSMKQVLVIAAMTVLGSSAFARGGAGGVYLGLNLGLSDDTTTITNSGVDTESKNPDTRYDLNLGYLWAGGLYVGAAMDTLAYGDTLKTSQSAMGVSVGYMAANGFRIIGHYYLSGSTSNVSADGDKFAETTGLGVDIGYLNMLSSSFGLGVELAYRSMSYKKYTNASGVDIDTLTMKSAYYSPRIILAFMF